MLSQYIRKRINGGTLNGKLHFSKSFLGTKYQSRELTPAHHEVIGIEQPGSDYNGSDPWVCVDCRRPLSVPPAVVHIRRGPGAEDIVFFCGDCARREDMRTGGR